MLYRIPLLLFLSAAIMCELNAQGCSDAGVCTAGPIGQLAPFHDSTANASGPRHSARLLYSYAVGEQSVAIMQVQPELTIGIGNRFSAQLKIPFVSASGDLGENSGVGDAIVTGAYDVIARAERRLTAMAGVRFPTGTTNAVTSPDKGSGSVILDAPAYALPMPYQTGLGTLDLLLGLQYRHDGWAGALAYQHVLDNGNENGFSHAAWNNDPAVLAYFESYMLDRGNDLVGRLQYVFGAGRLSVQPGALAIVRLQEDARLNDTLAMGEMGMERLVIEGSSGLTLNLTVDLGYDITDRWTAEAFYGSPLIVRDARPDGLTRSMVIGAAVRFRF